MVRVSKIIKIFGDWAVTVFGVECLREIYSIEKDRLTEDWIGHLIVKQHKPGAIDDLRNALEYARDKWNIKQNENLQKV